MEKVQKMEKGFLAVDLGTAMMVTVIFVTIMSSMMYSLYISSTEAKRTATALNYAVDIFEYIGKVPFQIVNANEVLNELTFVNSSEGTDNEATGKIGKKEGAYDITLKVEPQYNDNKIKLITLTITFKISNKNTKTIEFQRLKTI